MNTNDAICLAAVYHFADVAIFKKERVSVRDVISKLRIVRLDLRDADAIQDRYNALVLDAAADLRPELSETHDYWGARCLYKDPQWKAPKTGTVMCGDSPRVFLPCTSYAAILSNLQHDQP